MINYRANSWVFYGKEILPLKLLIYKAARVDMKKILEDNRNEVVYADDKDNH